MRQAVFLDRDGTIIEDVDYLRDPTQVRLLPGAAAAIARLNSGGLLAVVVTNQSGIAREMVTEDEYQAGVRRVDQVLEKKGAWLDAHYFCPHLPDVTGPCECRKPGTLLYRQAAARFEIDMQRSWWVGDRLRDVLAAEAFGGIGILVGETEPESEESRRFLRARDLAGAVDLILR